MSDVLRLRVVLEEIYERRGQLTPAIVLEEAESAESPLHDKLEWDDGVAGRAHRLTQCAALIRRVRFTSHHTGRPTEHRYFMHLPHGTDDDEDAAGASYVPEPVVRLDPAAKVILLAQAKREWKIFERRYKELESLWRWIAEQLPDTGAA